MAEKIEKFDWKETLLSNSIKVFWILIIYVFIKSFVNVMENITDQNMILILTIVLAYSVIRLITWIGQPIIIFKTKHGKLSYR